MKKMGQDVGDKMKKKIKIHFVCEVWPLHATHTNTNTPTINQNTWKHVNIC